MSLPKAPKDISSKPVKGSVVDPVDKGLQNKDIERKIKFYSVLQALSSNKYPTNSQIEETLQYVLTHSPVEQDKLSEDGKRLISDVRQIIATALDIVKAKNNDELVQAWLYGTRAELDVKGHAESAKFSAQEAQANVPDPEKRKKDVDQALDHLRTLAKLVLTNAEVRKLLSDLGLVGRDLLAQGAAKAATKFAPTAEQLAQVDESAPRDQFVESDKETPKFPNGSSSQDAHVDTPTESDDNEQGPSDISSEAEKIEQDPSLTADEKAAKKKSLKDRFKVTPPLPIASHNNSFSPRVLHVSPENRARLDQHRDRAQKFLLDDYFPKERRDQWYYRLKKVVIECQKHRDYQESLTWLLDIINEYASHVSKADSSKTSPITSDPVVRKSLSQLRTILERFANGNSMEPTSNAFRQLAQVARDDEGLRDWFKSINKYLHRVLLEAGYVLEPLCSTRGRELQDEGRKYYDEQYRPQFDALFRSAQNWLAGMREDPLNTKFGEDWARLTKDLLFDEDGSLAFKSHLWTDIRSTILPQLIAKIGYIPIPRIEYTDDSLDLVVENLVFSGRNIFPNIVSLDAHNFFKFSPYSSIKDQHKHEVTLGLGQIQADMRDVAFYFKKKTGIPKISDSGLADVVLGGEGVSASVHLVNSPENDASSLFQIRSCVVKVDSLKFKIRDSKHDLLYKTLRPLATGLIKKQVQKALRDAITTWLEYLDGQLVGVKQRYTEGRVRAKAEAANIKEGTSTHEEGIPTESPAMPNLDEKSSFETKAHRNNASRSHFRVVSDKRNSLLEGTGHPSGWVSKTAERTELAHAGEGWKSPAFSVVNGKETPQAASTH